MAKKTAKAPTKQNLGRMKDFTFFFKGGESLVVKANKKDKESCTFHGMPSVVLKEIRKTLDGAIKYRVAYEAEREAKRKKATENNAQKSKVKT